MGIWELIVIVLGTCGLSGIFVGTPLYFVYKRKQIDLEKKRMIEEHRTNNLALAYQILAARPEMSLEDVKLLMDNSGKNLLEGTMLKD